jgi:NitT/TauT family transport system ATP-binding protein
VLLLDEPFGALDPGTRKDMHELILRLWRENEMMIFMVTHDLQEGFLLGTRVMVFDKIPSLKAQNAKPGATITYDIPLTHRRKQCA